jgi:flavin reductase (DIM6/NTAB) family NADH-FMN oxidoreductase RutF
LKAKSQDVSLCNIPVVVITARDPMGQPIVSPAVAMTQAGGLSMPQLLACIEVLSGVSLQSARLAT